MGTLVVEAAPGMEVRVEQVRHEFWFGAALASQMFGGRSGGEDASKYRQVFLDNFNAAVTENALKWHSMERRKGEVDYSVADAILAWTAEHEIPLRGHNVYWGVPDMVQPWLKQLDDAALRDILKARALDVAHRYRGRFAEYDLNNEMLHGDYYEQRLGPGITLDMATWMRQEDPQAVLFLNDYDIVDYSTKWHGAYLQFIAKYACPGPNALSPSFESIFARLGYFGRDSWNIWARRHNDQWMLLGGGMTLPECFEEMRTNPWFHH